MNGNKIFRCYCIWAINFDVICSQVTSHHIGDIDCLVIEHHQTKDVFFGFIQLGIIFDQTLNLVIVFSLLWCKKGCNKKKGSFYDIGKTWQIYFEGYSYS